jgi:hypothetical protein
MFLLDDILLAPLKGVIWLGSKLNEVVEQEFSDEGKIKEQLMELQLRFELDEINEEDYERQEQELLERLEAISQSKEEG